MSLNRYRLRHLAKNGHVAARRAQALLERTDRLIGIILLGNNFVNILASSLATIIALRVWGESGIAIAAGLLTFVILIFAEVAPKTLAALRPEKVAFPASFVLTPLLRLLYPLIWVINLIANSLLRVVGVRVDKASIQHLSSEELRSVVNEAGTLIPPRHQKMLLNILDLEKVTVEDIMVPRNEIVGIDLDGDWEDATALVTSSQHTRLLVYRDNIENVVGITHLRNVLPLLSQGEFTQQAIEKIAKEPYYIPEGVALNAQLLNFQEKKRRIALVVDEYGDLQGLVTLEDLLEEIVGEFTSDRAATLRDVHPQNDGSYIVDGGINIRALNRILRWSLPTDGPKTLNGLIVEYLESIPESGTSLLVSAYPIEIVQTKDNTVKTARIWPAKARQEAE